MYFIYNVCFISYKIPKLRQSIVNLQRIRGYTIITLKSSHWCKRKLRILVFISWETGFQCRSQLFIVKCAVGRVSEVGSKYRAIASFLYWSVQLAELARSNHNAQPGLRGTRGSDMWASRDSLYYTDVVWGRPGGVQGYGPGKIFRYLKKNLYARKAWKITIESIAGRRKASKKFQNMGNELLLRDFTQNTTSYNWIKLSLTDIVLDASETIFKEN